MCTLYNVHKNIYFVHTFYLYQCISITQELYTVQNIHMLYAACEVCSVFAIHYTLYRIHYKYIVEVLEKIMRRTEMIASIIRSKGTFMDRAMD